MNAKVSYSLFCAVCNKEHVGAEEIPPVGMHVFGLAAPADWAVVTVGIPEPVVPANSEEIVNLIADLPGDPTVKQTFLDHVRKTSPRFHATFTVCPDCQKGGVWEAVNREFARVVLKDAATPAEMAGILSFPGRALAPSLFEPPPDYQLSALSFPPLGYYCQTCAGESGETHTPDHTFVSAPDYWIPGLSFADDHKASGEYTPNRWLYIPPPEGSSDHVLAWTTPALTVGSRWATEPGSRWLLNSEHDLGNNPQVVPFEAAMKLIVSATPQE